MQKKQEPPEPPDLRLQGGLTVSLPRSLTASFNVGRPEKVSVTLYKGLG